MPSQSAMKQKYAHIIYLKYTLCMWVLTMKQIYLLFNDIIKIKTLLKRIKTIVPKIKGQLES